MNEINEKIESLRKKIFALEQRESELSKKFDRLLGRIEKFDPELHVFMREGLPLEVSTRVTLIESGYEVHGYYPYHLRNSDSSITERSIDVYASRDSIFTVPQGKGQRSGESWPERNNLLAECKQRRTGVRWLFCLLPTSKRKWSIAGEDVPVVNAGFELRPSSEQGYQSSGNLKDVKNAIAQLNEAYIPFLVERERGDDGRFRNSLDAKAMGKEREHTWLLLVTNAALKVFQSQKFDSLISGGIPDTELFREVPWVVYLPEPSLSFLAHQRATVAPFVREEDKGHNRSIAEIMAGHPHEVHIVRHDHLIDFLALVADPPRVEQIAIKLAVDGGDPTTITIE